TDPNTRGPAPATGSRSNRPKRSSRRRIRRRSKANATGRLLAVLVGCGLRRGEASALTFDDVQQRDGRWCLVDVEGKGNRVRTVPMPAWTKTAIDVWSDAARLSSGRVFRPMGKG